MTKQSDKKDRAVIEREARDERLFQTGREEGRARAMADADRRIGELQGENSRLREENRTLQGKAAAALAHITHLDQQLLTIRAVLTVEWDLTGANLPAFRVERRK